MTNTNLFNGSKHQQGVVVPSELKRDVKESSEVVFIYLPKAKENEVIKREEVKELTFYQLLKPCYLKHLKQYLKTHRLSESEAYQMIVFLGMEVDDERKAEKMICDYICRYGLQSQKARQALKDLGFETALKVLGAKAQSDEACEEPTVWEKLCDGFLMLKDDDIADVGIFITYWGEPVQA
jgi:hypothetical protein